MEKANIFTLMVIDTKDNIRMVLRMETEQSTLMRIKNNTKVSGRMDYQMEKGMFTKMELNPKLCKKME